MTQSLELCFQGLLEFLLGVELPYQKIRAALAVLHLGLVRPNVHFRAPRKFTILLRNGPVK